MSIQMKAVMMIADAPSLKENLGAVIDTVEETIHWDELDYHSLSGGQQTAISWAYLIWTDRQASTELKFRDPFEGFGSLSRELQQVILTAYAFRHNTFAPSGKMEQFVRDSIQKLGKK